MEGQNEVRTGCGLPSPGLLLALFPEGMADDEPHTLRCSLSSLMFGEALEPGYLTLEV